MTRTEIEQQVIELVRKEKPLPDELLTPTTLLSDAGIDSLDSLTILFAIEEHFRISISDERAKAMRTFGDMVDIIDEQLARA